MKSSLEWKFYFAFALALAGIVALGVLQHHTARRLADDSQWVSHTRDVILELQSLRNNLNRADASVQSFVLNGDSVYLGSYNQATASMSERLQSLRKVTADSTAQQQRLDRLQPLISGSVRALQEEIDSRKTARPASSTLIPLEASIRASSDSARLLIGDMETDELQLLRARTEAAGRANGQANLFIVLGSLVAFVLTGASGVVLRLDIRARSRSEAKFRELLESAPDAMVIVDREGRIALVNTQTEKLFGYERKELLGKYVEMLMPEQYRGEHDAHRNGCFRTRRTRPMGRPSLELYASRKDGTEFPVEISMSLMEIEGEALVSEAMRDVTERKSRDLALRQLSGRLLQAQEEEQRRIGRELHDSVGQYLVALKIGLDSLRTVVRSGRPGATQKLGECIQIAEEAVKEIRTISYLLYPPLLDELGLRSAIPWYVEGFAKRSGIHTTIEIPSDFGRLTSETELAIFRVLQESLTNVHRHSGSLTAKVRVLVHDGIITLEVKDDGKGMSSGSLDGFRQDLPGTLGVGLRGMNERIRQLGGKLEVASTGHGTTIRATMPRPVPVAAALA